MNESKHDPPLNTEQVCDLVAYLDGELDEEQTEAVEQLLVESPVARREVDTLTQTWDLLELLPAEKASEDFTERTLATVRVDGTEPLATPPPWRRQARRGVALATWVAGLTLASIVGFLGTNRWMADESQPLLDDLPVIEKLDVYTDIDSVEFLEELHSSGILAEETDNDSP